MKYGVLMVIALGLAACTTTPVHLKHQETGKVVQCGPFRQGGPTGAVAAAMHEAKCIDDFKEQGYVRVPSSG